MSAVRSLLVAAAAAGACGCEVEPEDPALFVEPSIVSPALTVASSVLGTSLQGSFGLSLHLGREAAEASEVGVAKFSLMSADQTVTLTDLEVSTSASLPVTVEPGGDDVLVPFTFETGTALLPAETGEAICQAANVRITGVVDDSLQNGATPVASGVFQPAGCVP